MSVYQVSTAYMLALGFCEVPNSGVGVSLFCLLAGLLSSY